MQNVSLPLEVWKSFTCCVAINFCTRSMPWGCKRCVYHPSHLGRSAQISDNKLKPTRKCANPSTSLHSRRGRFSEIQQSQENRWQNKFTNVMESTEKTKMVGILRCMQGVHVHDQNDSTTQATNQSHLKSSPFQWGHFQLNQRGVSACLPQNAIPATISLGDFPHVGGLLGLTWNSDRKKLISNKTWL